MMMKMTVPVPLIGTTAGWTNLRMLPTVEGQERARARLLRRALTRLDLLSRALTLSKAGEKRTEIIKRV